MKVRRRLIAWSFFAGLLTALGVVVFHWVRYQPRFVVEGPHELVHLSDDGRWLVTSDLDVSWSRNDFFTWYPARLHVFDTHAGRLIRSFEVVRYPSHLPGIVEGVSQSPDGRYFACCRETDCLLIDWQSGRQWTIPIGKAESPHTCDFSVRGRWLKIKTGDADERSIVVEVATGTIARRFPCRVAGFFQDDRVAVCCADTNRVDFVDMVTGHITMAIKSSIDVRQGTVTIMATADGRWLAFGRQIDRMSGSSFHDIEIWDVPNRRRRLHLEYEEGASTEVVFSPRGTHFATGQLREDSYKVEVCDFEKRDPVLRASWARKQMHNAVALQPWALLRDDFFSSDGGLLLVPTNDESRAKLAIFDIAAGAMMWEQAGYQGEWLAGGDQLLCTSDTDGGVHLLDANTGLVRSKIGQECTAIYDARSTSDGRVVLVRGWRDPGRPAAFWKKWLEQLGAKWLASSNALVIVAESSTGVESLCLPATEHSWAWLSEDGETLATWTGAPYLVQGSEANGGVQLWDTSPRRAYLWAVAVSFVMACVSLLLRHWRQKRKAVV